MVARVRQVDRDAFATAVDASLAGRPCRPAPAPRARPSTRCSRTSSRARAGNFEVCMDSYATPALLTDDAFGALVDRALAARP